MTTNPLPSPVCIAGCGYLGRALGDALSRSGVETIALTHTAASARERDETESFSVLNCDITSRDALRELSRRIPEPRVVVHCASSGRGGPDRYDLVYHQGCENLAAAFPEATLLFTSSTSVYAQTDGETVSESSPAEPDRETGKILLRTEDFVRAQEGVVLRLAGIYGPGRSVILQRFLEDRAIIETGTSRYLNQIHRDDIVSAVLTVLGRLSEVRGEVLNVVDGHPLTQRACYEALAEWFDRPLPPEGPPDPNRKRGWTHKRVDPARLRVLGWSPRYRNFLEAVRHDPEFVPSIARFSE